MLIATLLAQAAAVVAPAQQGVISYPPAFFADFQPANAGEMVARLPGFTLESGDNVRGYEGAAGNVLVNGERPATKSDNLDNILRRLPASRIERIDLIRGGAPGIDMQGKTVLANIVLKPGGGFRGVAAVARNYSWDNRSAGSVRFEASDDIGQVHWETAFVGGKFIDDGSANGEGLRIDAQGRQTPVDVEAEADGLNGVFTAALEAPLAGGKLRINGRLFTEKYKNEETDVVLGAPVVVEQNVNINHSDDTEIGGSFTRKLGEKASLDLVALRQTRDRDVDSDFANGGTSAFRLRRESTESIGRAVLKYRLTDRFSVEGGGEYAVNEQDSVTGVFANGLPVPLPAANVQVREDRAEGFLKSVWRPVDTWTVDASLRYERSKIGSEGDVVLSKTLQYLKPRVAVTWAPRSSTQVRLRLEREVGQLNFNDFVATANLNDATGVSAGNPDLNPEQAWVGEAAVEHRFWGSGSATLSFRHFELSDVVDRGPVTQNGKTFDRPANIGDGTKDELQFAFSLPLARLGAPGATLRADITQRWSKVADPTNLDGREISNLRPIDWTMNFTQDLPAWKLSYGVDAFGGWRETSYRYNLIQTTKVSTYVRPFLEYRPRADINLRVELPNVTARSLRRSVLFYPATRAGVSVATLDAREYDAGQMFYFRLRKTLGG